jgi:hypothetical protein
MRFKAAFIVAAFVMLFRGGDLFAQAKTNITAAHFKAAEEVLQASGVDVQFKESIEALVNQYSEQVAVEKREKFKQVLNTFMAKYASWDNVKDSLSSIYAEAFSEAELKQLAAFYQTPLGKKLVREQPFLLQKSVQFGQTLIASHQVELQQLLQDVFKDK